MVFRVASSGVTLGLTGWSGLGTNQLLYSTGATTLAQSANLLYDETSGPRLQVGSGATTSQGWLLGYGGSSNVSFLWGTDVTPSGTNYILQTGGNITTVNAIGTGGIRLSISNIIKGNIWGTAGRGFDITAGTATTDVQALSVTQTLNAAGVAFTHEKHVVTIIAAAAGSLLVDYQTGAGSQFSVGTTGLITTGGTAGVSSFGPAAVVSITVKNGIITAIS